MTPWNRDPQKTIELFKESATYYKALPNYQDYYLYCKTLVAHAYDKIQDSVNTTAILRDLNRELAEKDAAFLQEIPFTTEMALFATEVRAYSLADSLLSYLPRQLIINDTGSYDFLNHYYLTQSRLDIFYRRLPHSLYVDSLQQVYDKAKKLLNLMYYSKELALLYSETGDFEKSSNLYAVNLSLTDSLTKGDEVSKMQRALEESELLAEKRKTEYHVALQENKQRLIWILCGLLSIITAMSIYLYSQTRKARRQAVKLEDVNQKLDVRVGQVELLNKEIQHRVKNNLHMIYSLLHMQERKTENDDVIAALQDARLRVESVAALHNMLLVGKENLNLADFIKKLIASVVSCLGDDIHVITHITTDEIAINDDNYLELALILNEWVTNSIKYAARSSNNAIEIEVDVKQLSRQTCITYHDSGVAKAISPGAPGLGTQIISLLTQQMGAELTTLNHHPYHYQLCIPDTDHGA